MNHLLIKKLNIIFWGVILLIVDFDISIGLFKIDLLNDFIASIMIYKAISYIKDMAPLNEEYQSAMKVAILAVRIIMVFSLIDFVDFDLNGWFAVFKSIINLVVILGILRFCTGMKIFSSRNLLKDSTERWQLCEKLILWIYAVPIGILGLVNSIFTGLDFTPFYYTKGLEGIGLLVFLFGIILFSYPLIFGLHTISKMKTEINDYGGILVEID